MNRVAQFGAGLRLRDLYNYKQISDQSRQLNSSMRDLAGKQDAVAQAMISLETSYTYYVGTYDEYQALSTQLEILQQQTTTAQRKLQVPPVPDKPAVVPGQPAAPGATVPASQNPNATTPAPSGANSPPGSDAPTGNSRLPAHTSGGNRRIADVGSQIVSDLGADVDKTVGGAAAKGLSGITKGGRGANLKTALKWAGAGIALYSAYKLGGAGGGADAADANKPLTQSEAAQLKAVTDDNAKRLIQIQALMPRVNQEVQAAFQGATAAKKELDTSFQDYATTVAAVKKQQTSLSQLMQGAGDWFEELSDRRNQEAE